MQIAFQPGSRRAYQVPSPMRLRLSGLGSDSSIATMAASGAATTASILGGISAATTAAATGGFLAGATIFGMAASAAIPLIGVAIAGLTAIGIAIAAQFKGCGQTCVQTTQIVQQVEPLLLQNLNNYTGAPIHYASLQAAALNNFDTAWAAVVQACNQVGGQGGAGCISDRQQGACHIKNSDGSCFNWFIAYRDPIANDQFVVPDFSLADITTPTADTWAQALSIIKSQNGSDSASWDQWSYYWQNSPTFSGAPYAFGIPGGIQANTFSALVNGGSSSDIISAEQFIAAMQTVTGTTVSELSSTPITLTGPGGAYTGATGAQVAAQAAAGTISGIPMPLILIGGGLLVVMSMMGGGKSGGRK